MISAALQLVSHRYTLARDDAQKVAIKDVPLKLEVAAVFITIVAGNIS